jgi:hypothetical protein
MIILAISSLTGVPAGVIAIDGKTSRRSVQKPDGKAAIHMAFAARQRLALGQDQCTLVLAAFATQIWPFPIKCACNKHHSTVTLFAKFRG